MQPSPCPPQYAHGSGSSLAGGKPPLYSHEGMVDSCWATECVHVPFAASGPQTASMKSFMMPSNSVEFQLVAGLVSVQSGGVSSGTTTRGYGHQGAYLTKSAPSSDSARW